MFDPALPANNSPLVSAEMRAQLNGLKDLIDAIQSITTAVVDGVSTVNPGEAASVSLSVVGSTLHFSFGIPRGQDGPAGPVFGNTVVDGVTTLNAGEAATVQTSFDGSNVRFQFGIPRGNDGSNGTNGSDGMQGPPFTNFVIDGVTTLNPMDPASVQASFDGNAVRLLFGIPRGNDGNNGNDGMQGPPGAPFTNFVVDGVTTLNPTDPATVNLSFDGSQIHFTFGIPRGSEGLQGPGGNDGMQGPPGAPFTNFVVDGVTTLNPGEPATVIAGFDGNAVRLLFGIPRGNDGGTGPQGVPGEVTSAELNSTVTSAVNGTSSNSNAVNTLNLFAAGSYDETQMQQVMNKLDELILALRR
jgi:hypothetical protein